MWNKVLKHLVNELDSIRPILSGTIGEIKLNLIIRGYIDVGVISNVSRFGIGSKLDMKKSLNPGRYQIHLFENRRGRIDYDMGDLDKNVLGAAAHLLDLVYFSVAEALDILPFKNLKLDKNYIEFNY